MKSKVKYEASPAKHLLYRSKLNSSVHIRTIVGYVCLYHEYNPEHLGEISSGKECENNLVPFLGTLELSEGV